MIKNNILTSDNIKNLIADKLYDKGIINDEVYEKCGKPHISSLPHDLRTNDPEKLQQRKDAVIEKWKEVDDEITEKNYPKEFWDIATNIDRYSEEMLTRRGKEFYDGDRVIKYFDNMLNTKKSLNDVIREHYDTQINNLEKYIDNYAGHISEKTEYIDNLIKDNKKLEKEIEKGTKELSKENKTLDKLQSEFSQQDDLQRQYIDHREVLDTFTSQLNVNWEDYVKYDNNGNYMIDSAKLRQIHPDLPGYVSETFEVFHKYKQGREISDINHDINSVNENIEKLNLNINANKQKISVNEGLIDEQEDQLEWNMTKMTQTEQRVRNLKKSKPNKQPKDDNYTDLVYKKNLAIAFKSDLNKAHDYQDELVKINSNLGVDDVWDGIPVTKPTKEYVLGTGY